MLAVSDADEFEPAPSRSAALRLTGDAASAAWCQAPESSRSRVARPSTSPPASSAAADHAASTPRQRSGTSVQVSDILVARGLGTSQKRATACQELQAMSASTDPQGVPHVANGHNRIEDEARP
jgi:hypothetical protein